MNRINLRGSFWFVRFLFYFTDVQLEIIGRKINVSKVFISILFSLLSLTVLAQETHNLEIIWERGTPGDSLFSGYGEELSSGDFNGDGYSDIVVKGDSWVDPLHGISICKAYIFWGDISLTQFQI